MVLETNCFEQDNIPNGDANILKRDHDSIENHIKDELNRESLNDLASVENATKKSKLSEEVSPKKEIDIKPTPVKVERCDVCRQYIDEVLWYNGHPNNSVDEYITLTDERLMLFTGGEQDMDEVDERPTHKITFFSVYDKQGHLCSFDSGLIEENKLLYFSGYVKPVYDEDPSTENGLPTKEMGPINEWYLSGFDGGDKAVVGFSTAYGEYYLMEPSPEYKPIMDILSKKILLAKVIIEFLLDESWEKPNYEDLLQRLDATGDPDLNEDFLLQHAQFICDRVNGFDATGTDDDDLLITAPCMRSLVKMSGVTFKNRQKIRKIETKGIKKKQTWSKATTTNLVREVFETFFIDQIDGKEKDDKGPRRKRCGVCEACQTPDCGKCTHCCDMLKFGGSGRSKQACLTRRCPNMAIQTANEESDAEDEQVTIGKSESSKTCSKRIIHKKVHWVGEPAVEHKDRVYYHVAKVGDIQVASDEYVMLHSEEPNQPLLIARIGYMWEDGKGDCMFHAHLFCRGSDTVLGETSDPRELFLVDVCENCPVGTIVRRAQVEFRQLADNWALNGGLDKLPPQLEDNGETFFFRMRYDSEFSRFEDISVEKTDPSMPYTPCQCCSRRALSKKKEVPLFIDDAIHWQDDVYRVGSGVFLEPDAYKFKSSAPSIDSFMEKENIDEDIYPEYYRKPAENLKGSNLDTPEPFCIGLIEEIINTPKSFLLKVRKFYRPENTNKGIFVSYQLNLNLIYWSDEVVQIDFNKVTGKCHVVYSEALDCPVDEWCEKGPYRFYFSEVYDAKLNKFSEDVPSHAAKIGRGGKGKGKGKGKSKNTTTTTDLPPVWDNISKPLNCMDVFAGCGGLSEGLHQSGVAVSKWGIEKEPAAAHAFKLNNPEATVYTEDCNELLRCAISGETKNGKALPARGEVELLVGGPPCQGFSGMNRFNAGQYSIFKNSLIISYLSYCDYYRPKYFILENVRNFVSFKRSMILKLTLRCLVAIGYQVTFGVLQAGHYGVPQTRRRLIIIAAAPGYTLPKYPEPQHVFNKKGCQLSVVVDNFKYYTGVRWGASAPFRTITVRDAMSDLPEIRNGCSIKEMPYDSDPITHFQRLVRKFDHTGLVSDHICKEMAALVEARMTHIPLYPGSDWRDLPNIVIRLSDGNFTNKLRYPHRSKKQTKGGKRGVCLCATGKGCDPADRQLNTLIPWCLPHTGDRHNNWAGLYGRLDWDGFFSTTVTNPEPMGKQGRVLHPEQHRVVSVRECARSQGFPDRYQFYGNILDKHRQVGNAVPPPLGVAVGREIMRAIAITEQKD